MHDAKKKIKDFLFTKDLLVNSNRYFISIKQCMTLSSSRSWVRYACCFYRTLPTL